MKLKNILVAAILLCRGVLAFADGLAAPIQAKVDEHFKAIAAWAADPVIVEAVKAHNASVPAEQAALNQDKRFGCILRQVQCKPKGWLRLAQPPKHIDIHTPPLVRARLLV